MLDITAITQELEAKLKQLTSELSMIALHNEDADDWEALPTGTESAEPDTNDEADVVEEWNERRATVAVLEVDYRNTKRALGKIAAGTFGRCEVSGEPIEENRLRVNPLARTCIAHMNDEGSLPL